MQVIMWVWCAFQVLQAVAFVIGLFVALFDRREDPRFEGDKLIYRS